MPSREHELDHRPEAERPPYLKAARFHGERPAGAVYSQLEAAIFRSDCDLSCFRLQLNRAWHVAVLGLPPPHDVAERIDALLSSGEPADLPPEVTNELRRRRARSVASGALWMERHYRPTEDPNLPLDNA